MLDSAGTSTRYGGRRQPAGFSQSVTYSLPGDAREGLVSSLKCKETHHAPTRISAATLVALAACSSMDQTTGPSLARGGNSEATRPRPLKGSCDTEVTILSVGPDGRLDLSIEYTCQISHLGRTHNTVLQSVIPTGPPVGVLLPASLSNTGTYVAANGDRVNSSFTGTGVTNLADFTAVFEGTETFLPGTGRFADASGTAEVQGTAALNPATGTGTAHFTLEGSITY